MQKLENLGKSSYYVDLLLLLLFLPVLVDFADGDSTVSLKCVDADWIEVTT